MSKQLMIYANAVPLSADDHRNLSVLQNGGYGFSSDLNSVPLVLAEFEKAAAEYPVVFAGDVTAGAAAITPAAIVGLRDGENLFVDGQGVWTGRYIPAFLRRYPFVFAESADKSSLTLCIDTTYEGLDTTGKGERLFDSAGNRTQYLETTLRFTSDYQTQHAVTRAFIAQLVELDLLEPATANATLADGNQLTLGGFSRVSAERLAALPDATVLEMFRNGMLTLIHIHMQSMQQMPALLARAESRAAT